MRTITLDQAISILSEHSIQLNGWVVFSVISEQDDLFLHLSTTHDNFDIDEASAVYLRSGNPSVRVDGSSMFLTNDMGDIDELYLYKVIPAKLD